MDKHVGISAIVFDMDGVIVDSEPLHLKAKQLVFEIYDLDFSETHNQQYLGCKDLIMFRDMVTKHKLNVSAEKLVMAKEAMLCQLVIDKAVPRPGVLEVLLNARRAELPLAIASSGAASAVNLVLELFGIKHFFKSVSTGDDVSNGKPAPDVYSRAAKELGLEPERCLAVEDTANGITAAKRAGMLCCAIPCDSTAHEDHSHADFRYKCLTQLDISKLLRMSVKKGVSASRHPLPSVTEFGINSSPVVLGAV